MQTEALQAALRGCSFHALQLVVAKALARSGYGDVQLMGRRKVSEKSSHGGHELCCISPLGDMAVKIVVKVINDDIRVRMLDEIVGVADRCGARAAIVVTPQGIGRTAARELVRYRSVRVKIIDGPRLAELLAKHSLGVRGRGEVDYAYFGQLEELSKRILRFLAKEGR